MKIKELGSRWNSLNKQWDSFMSKDLFSSLWGVAEIVFSNIKESYDNHQSYSISKNLSKIKRKNLIIKLELIGNINGSYLYKININNEYHDDIYSIKNLKTYAVDSNKTLASNIIVSPAIVLHDGYSCVSSATLLGKDQYFSDEVIFNNKANALIYSNILGLKLTDDITYDEYTWKIYALMCLSKRPMSKRNITSSINIFCGALFSKYMAMIKRVGNTVHLVYKIPVISNHSEFKKKYDKYNSYVFLDIENNKIYESDFPEKTLYFIHKWNISYDNGEYTVNIPNESYSVDINTKSTPEEDFDMVNEFYIIENVVDISVDIVNNINIIDDQRYVANVEGTNTLNFNIGFPSYKVGDFIDIDIVSVKPIDITVLSDYGFYMAYTSEVSDKFTLFSDIECTKVISISEKYYDSGILYIKTTSNIGNISKVYCLSNEYKMAEVHSVNSVTKKITITRTKINSTFVTTSLSKMSYVNNLSYLGNYSSSDTVTLVHKDVEFPDIGSTVTVIYENGYAEEMIVHSIDELNIKFTNELSFKGKILIFDKKRVQDTYDKIKSSFTITVKKGIDIGNFDRDFYEKNILTFKRFFANGYMYDDSDLLED